MAIAAPMIATALALLVHWLVPNRQTAIPTRAYPVVLVAILIGTFGLAVVHRIWRRSRPWICHHGPLIAGVVLWFCLWDLITLKMAWMPLPYFPGPDMVLQSLVDDWAMLLDSAYHSITLLLGGYSIGVVAGLISGVLIGWFRQARYWGMPVLKLVGPIPATAYLPLVMVLFSSAFVSASVMIGMAVWFPVTMLTVSGVANVPKSYLDVARTLGAGRGFLIFRVAIPAALPSIFVGLFMGLCASFLTLMAAETVGVRAGLGWYLKWQQGYVEYAKVYAALLIMAVFFSSLMTLLFKLRDRVLGWQKGLIRW